MQVNVHTFANLATKNFHKRAHFRIISGLIQVHIRFLKALSYFGIRCESNIDFPYLIILNSSSHGKHLPTIKFY